ncbi:MAG: putative transporter [Porphyromonas sp.]|nr:putative transporter [Porphyromonas sp.]
MWINDIISFFTEPSILQAVMALFIVSGIGMYLGSFSFKGVSFGLSMVFFIGIICSHFGLRVDPEILSFTINIGLILYVYTLGLQVGPAFIESLKKRGIVLNLWALAVILFSIVVVVVLYLVSGQSLPHLMGVLSGAVTNMPALGAAQEAVGGVLTHQGVAQEVLSKTLAEMSMATAIAYPFGVVGVFIAIALLKKRVGHSGSSKEESDSAKTVTKEYLITNKAIFNKPIKEIMRLYNTPMLVSQIWRKGEFLLPKSDTILQEGDHILVVSEEDHHPKILLLFGQEASAADSDGEIVDWDQAQDSLASRWILVTKQEINGVRLASLELRNQMNINVTSVIRAGISLLPSPSLRLQMGDRLSVVGKEGDLKKLSQMMGDELKKLDTPYLVTLFVGMLLGCVLGAIPIVIPGISTPIKMGIAGGPLIMGILMSAYGTRFHLNTYITSSANLMIRTFGIVLFMAALGLSSGEGFFQTLSQGPGLIWMVLGTAITLLPPLIVGFICMKWFKISFNHTAGMICGSMANPIALDYASSLTKSESVAVSYVTVYPLTMFARVIAAQLTVGLIMG